MVISFTAILILTFLFYISLFKASGKDNYNR